MSSVPLHEGQVVGAVADRRAADINNARCKLESGRATLDRYRANELAEAEALALARIRADSERALAHQAQVIRDAERAAELVAIERRSTDLEVIKESQLRQTLEAEAEAAAVAHAIADQLAATAALEKKSVVQLAHEKHQSRLAQQREALKAKSQSRRAQIGLAWLQLRNASPLLVGVVALLLGIGATWLTLTLQNHSRLFSPAEVPLKLDHELLTAPTLPQAKRALARRD